MKIFNYEGTHFTLNIPEILMIKEFDYIFNLEKGAKRPKAMRIFKYIYLVHDWKSPYCELNNEEKVKYALMDCELKYEDVVEQYVKDAIEKYRTIQESRKVKLLASAYRAMDELRIFYHTVDLQERDAVTGRTIHSAKDLVANLKQLGDLVKGIEILEEQVRREKETGNTRLRGDTEAGLFDL